MKLNRDSWLVKLAYLPEKCKVPEEGSICALFWRVLLAPVFAVGWLYFGVLAVIVWPALTNKGPRLARLAWASALAGFVLAALVALIIDDPRQALITLGILVGLLLLAAGGLFVYEALESRGTFDREPLVVAYLKAKKQRFCPRVEFV